MHAVPGISPHLHMQCARMLYERFQRVRILCWLRIVPGKPNVFSLNILSGRYSIYIEYYFLLWCF